VIAARNDHAVPANRNACGIAGDFDFFEEDWIGGILDLDEGDFPLGPVSGVEVVAVNGRDTEMAAEGADFANADFGGGAFFLAVEEEVASASRGEGLVLVGGEAIGRAETFGELVAAEDGFGLRF